MSGRLFPQYLFHSILPLLPRSSPWSCSFRPLFPCLLGSPFLRHPIQMTQLFQSWCFYFVQHWRCSHPLPYLFVSHSISTYFVHCCSNGFHFCCLISKFVIIGWYPVFFIRRILSPFNTIGLLLWESKQRFSQLVSSVFFTKSYLIPKPIQTQFHMTSSVIHTFPPSRTPPSAPHCLPLT